MPSPASPAERIGRYLLYGPLASGGMATVCLGRLLAESGPSPIVAIKRLHPHLAEQSEFLAMLVDEGRLATRLRHPNLVQTLEVVVGGPHVLLVMEYVHSVALSTVAKRNAEEGVAVPPAVAAAIVHDVLRGLHAAHEATDERGQSLGIVHRDVSPPNILVGADGVSRVADFGIAKATGRLQTTRDGQLKGKLSYMAPEQLSAAPLDRRTDLYATAIVLWELLVGRRLFVDADGEVSLTKVMGHVPAPPSGVVPSLGSAYDDVVMRGLQRDARRRFGTAAEMADALAAAGPLASPREVAAWVRALAGDVLAEREAMVAAVEAEATGPRAAASVPMAEPVSREGRRWLVALGLLGAGLLAGIGVAAVRSRGEASAAPAVAETLAVAAPAPSPSPSPSPSPAPAVEVTPLEAAASAPTAAPAPAVASSSSPPLSPSPKARVGPRPAAKVRGRCDPPYDIDEQGVKRYRPACL